ncbi:MAG: DNA-3-methyladenine glycosylase [Nitrososphaerota archaeon]
MVDISTGKILPRSFYERDPACVARDLLGNVLVRRLGEVELSGRIVEVEAYYGEDDPASKAYGGRAVGAFVCRKSSSMSLMPPWGSLVSGFSGFIEALS